MQNLFLALTALCLTFTGHQVFPRPQSCTVVTEISVTTQDPAGAYQQSYTDQYKMSQLLNHIRHLDRKAQTEPEASTLPDYEISVIFSDGSTVHYVQKGLDYFQTGDGPWRKIDPEQGIRLPLLLAAIPADA